MVCGGEKDSRPPLYGIGLMLTFADMEDEKMPKIYRRYTWMALNPISSKLQVTTSNFGEQKNFIFFGGTPFGPLNYLEISKFSKLTLHDLIYQNIFIVESVSTIKLRMFAKNQSSKYWNMKKICQNFYFDKMCAIRSNFNILSSSFLQTSLIW